MSTSTSNPYAPPVHAGPALASVPSWRQWLFYYGWVNVCCAALAMLATLPGRTHGLGLITEPLLKSLQLDRGTYAQINLWATLLGAVFCLPAGRLVDRFGTRSVLTVVLLALGLSVWLMSGVQSIALLALCVLLTRGFGQSALSVVSIAMVGKWFTRRAGLAMSIYSVLILFGFATAFGVIGPLVLSLGWRPVWSGIGLAVLAFAPLGWLLVRSTPESIGAVHEEAFGQPEPTTAEPVVPTGLSLSASLRTPAFWVFATAISLFGLASSGFGLFNEAILAERGFDAAIYHQTLVLTTLVSLLTQLACMALVFWCPLPRLLAFGMLVYAGGLASLAWVSELTHVYLFATAMGVAAGIITVVFFAVWGHAFGRAHLGRIQGAAQLTTVLASAVGPLAFAVTREQTGSYLPICVVLAVVVFGLAIAAVFTPLPRPDQI